MSELKIGFHFIRVCSEGKICGGFFSSSSFSASTSLVHIDFDGFMWARRLFY